MARYALVFVVVLLVAPNISAEPQQEVSFSTSWQEIRQRVVEWIFTWGPERTESQKHGALIVPSGVQAEPQEHGALIVPSGVQRDPQEHGALIVPSGVVADPISEENVHRQALQVMDISN